MRGEGLAAGGVGGGRGRVWYGDPGVGQWGRADEGFAGGESLEWTCREQGEREDEREKADECEDWSERGGGWRSRRSRRRTLGLAKGVRHRDKREGILVRLVTAIRN